MKTDGSVTATQGVVSLHAQRICPVLPCDTLVGDDVVNAGGEALGRIAHIVLDVSQGKVAYAVLAHGGVFGIGEKLFAVPWSAFVPDAERGCFVLDIQKERLEKARGVDRERWRLQ
jgi:hypothetical protein